MIAVFLNNLIPYHRDRWNAYVRNYAVDCLLIGIAGQDEFRVLELADGETTAFRRATLFPHASFEQVSRGEMHRAVHRTLDECRPELVCLNGYSYPYNWSALDWCLRNNVPTVVCSESNEFDELRRPWKEAVKRVFVRHCAAGLVGGRPQADYLIKLGLSSDHVFTGYDVVSNDHFSAGADTARARAVEVRKQRNLPEKYFLACSRFVQKKNLPFLIKAYARYRQLAAASGVAEGEPLIWDLVLIGDGEEKAAIEQTIAGHEVGRFVHLVGPKTYDQLPDYYGLASAFVHASTTEQWGLVVNEAMASGLPVLVSNRCGCAPDLVKEGVNGFTFHPWDLEEIARKMLQFSETDTLAAMGKASRKIIANWSPDKFAQGMAQASKAAFSRPAPSLTWFDRSCLWVMLQR